MAKFFGVIGFSETKETKPGVWEEEITEREYYGDLNRNTRRLQSASDKLNDNINITNEISIISDPYVNENIYAIKYVKFMGSKWKVSDVNVQFPRLILTLGGLYVDDE